MKFNNFDIEKVFEEYVSLNSSKEVTYVLPDSIVKNASETKSDLLEKAHPEGSKYLEGIEAVEELGLIEDLQGLHNKMLKLVDKGLLESRAGKIASGLLAISQELDDAGLHAEAVKLDSQAINLLKQKSASVSTNFDNLAKEVESKVSVLAKEVFSNRGKFEESAKRRVVNLVASLHSDAKELEFSLNDYDFSQALNSLNTIKEKLNTLEKDISKIDLSSISLKDLIRVVDNAVKDLTQPKPHKAEHDGSSSNHKVMMLKVQKKVNELLSKLNYNLISHGVVENGDPGDSDTYKKIKDFFKLEPGKDYSNWSQLLSKLDQKADAMMSEQLAKEKSVTTPLSMVER